MSTYRQEAAELGQLAEVIGLELTVIDGRPWAGRVDDWRVFIDGTDELSLYIRRDKGRIEVSTSGYPQTPEGMRRIAAHDILKYGEHMPHISVSASRGAYAAAQDIAARLLPVYREHYAKVAAYIAAEIVKYHTAHAAGKMLARAYGAGARPIEQSLRDSWPTYYTAGGKFEVYRDSDGWRITIETAVGLDKARRILQIMGEG